MKLHTNKELFKDAVIATAQKQEIKEIFVEKDYWVTLILKAVFENEIGKETVFKGGTALSKCNSLIKRFSEDIDLVVLRNEEETGNQLKKKLKTISKCIENIVPETEIDGITNKKGMIRKTAHSYEKLFSGKFGQIRNFIVIESSWLGNYEPYEKGIVSSMIYEMMSQLGQQEIIEKYEMEPFEVNVLSWLGNYEPYEKGIVSSMIYEMMSQLGQQEIIEKYEMEPFEVNVLSPKRTICEKIMSLVRFSYSENPIEELSNKIRHIYDIHILLKNREINSFFNSENFDRMLQRVGNDDIFSFKNNNEWLKEHPISALIFDRPKYTWKQLKNTYNSSFKELVYEELPTEDEILKTLEIISKRLKKIEWNIK